MWGLAASWAFSHNAFLSSFLPAATWSSSSVFTLFYLRSVQFSSSGVFISGLLCLIAPWFHMFFVVFSFSVVPSFSSLQPSYLFFFILSFRFPSFQLGVRAFGGGGVLTLLCFVSDSSSKEFRVWLLMPSVLLVRQIPYRALSRG